MLCLSARAQENLLAIKKLHFGSFGFKKNFNALEVICHFRKIILSFRFLIFKFFFHCFHNKHAISSSFKASS